MNTLQGPLVYEIMIELKEILESDHTIYKTLILRGLNEDQSCFRIAPEDELSEPFPTNEEQDSFTLGAFDEEQLIGVVSFIRDGQNRRKLRHKGILFRLYVDPNFRGKGVAKLLIEAVIDRVKLIENIEQINLTVIPTNKQAKAIYEKFGFQTFASEEKAIKWEGQYFSEDQMKLLLK